MTNLCSKTQRLHIRLSPKEYDNIVSIVKYYGFSTLTQFFTEAINYYVGYRIVKPVREVSSSTERKHYCSRICTRSPDFESCTFKECPLYDMSVSGGRIEKQEEQA